MAECPLAPVTSDQRRFAWTAAGVVVATVLALSYMVPACDAHAVQTLMGMAPRSGQAPLIDGRKKASFCLVVQTGRTGPGVEVSMATGPGCRCEVPMLNLADKHLVSWRSNSSHAVGSGPQPRELRWAGEKETLTWAERGMP